MLAVGLTVTGGESLAALRDRRPMGRVILANLVLVPIMGYLRILIFPLSPSTKLAFAHLALEPTWRSLPSGMMVPPKLLFTVYQVIKEMPRKKKKART
jgi:predicted Na+-dependent transporter